MRRKFGLADIGPLLLGAALGMCGFGLFDHWADDSANTAFLLVAPGLLIAAGTWLFHASFAKRAP